MLLEDIRRNVNDDMNFWTFTLICKITKNTVTSDGGTLQPEAVE